MPWYLRNLLARGGYMNEADDGDGGSGGSDEDGGGKGGEGKPDDGANGKGEDGKHKPTDAEAALIKEVMEKKNKLKAAEEKTVALEAKLKQFDGIDPEAVKALLNEKKEAETKKLEAKGEWDRLKAQMAEEHGKEKSALMTKLGEMEGEVKVLRGTVAELTVGNAFAQSSFIQNELALTPSKTRVVYGGHFEFVDGQVIGYDKPTGQPNRTPLVDAKGDPLAFEAALQKIVDADPDKEQLLKSKMKQGAGSKTASKTGAPNVANTSDIKGKDRIAQALLNGGLG